MRATQEKDNTEIIISTKDWVRKFVIGLNLCPFAQHPFESDRIKYEVSSHSDMDSWIESFISECNYLIQTPKSECSTTLLIIPNGLEDFSYYLDMLETFQDMLTVSKLDDILQLASFHPQYQFDGSVKDEVSNFTNRSPFPMIHLLRVEEVSEAIKKYGDTSEIPIRNQRTLRELGRDKIMKNYFT